MDDSILISNLNDFIFCPASIYFHNLYGSSSKMMYQSTVQKKGTNAHEAVDQGTYSTKKDVLMGVDIYSEKYGLVGKIDLYDGSKKRLTERKKKIKVIYDGYVFQIYAQYFAMKEMGYDVQELKLYSMDDNKSYAIELPENNEEMLLKFEKLIRDIRTFSLDGFAQDNKEKCKNCIYEPACDRGLV